MIDQSKRVVLLGGGGHALVIAEAAIEAGFELIGVYDDDPSCVLANRRRIKHLGRLADIPQWNGYDKEHQLQRFIIGLGQIPDRERLLKTFGHGMGPLKATVIHPRATVSADARVNHGGGFISAGAVIQCHATLGFDAIINTGAIVEHECVIGNNTHIAPGAILGGRVHVGDHTLVGLGARVLPNLKIGSHCTIGAGAVVVENVGDGKTVVGVPARGR